MSATGVKRKPRRPRAKLTPEAVRKIRASPMTAPAIAAKYRLGPRAIYNVRWLKTWRDAE